MPSIKPVSYTSMSLADRTVLPREFLFLFWMEIAPFLLGNQIIPFAFCCRRLALFAGQSLVRRSPWIRTPWMCLPSLGLRREYGDPLYERVPRIIRSLPGTRRAAFHPPSVALAVEKIFINDLLPHDLLNIVLQFMPMPFPSVKTSRVHQHIEVKAAPTS